MDHSPTHDLRSQNLIEEATFSRKRLQARLKTEPFPVKARVTRVNTSKNVNFPGSSEHCVNRESVPSPQGRCGEGEIFDNWDNP